MAEELEERAPRAWRVRVVVWAAGWPPLLCYDISPVERAHLAPIPRRHRARARAQNQPRRPSQGRTTGTPSEGVGGDIWHFSARETSPRTSLHARHFFEICQLGRATYNL